MYCDEDDGNSRVGWQQVDRGCRTRLSTAWTPEVVLQLPSWKRSSDRPVIEERQFIRLVFGKAVSRPPILLRDPPPCVVLFLFKSSSSCPFRERRSFRPVVQGNPSDPPCCQSQTSPPISPSSSFSSPTTDLFQNDSLGVGRSSGRGGLVDVTEGTLLVALVRPTVVSSGDTEL